MVNKEDKQPAYRIEFKNSGQVVSICNNIPQMEMAVKIALSLHECSNTEHIIHVIHDDIIDVTFVRYVSGTDK